MTQTYFAPQKSPEVAFRDWEERLKSASESIAAVIENPTESYVRAMKICASGRMLTMEVYDAWRMDRVRLTEVATARDFMLESLRRLQEVEQRRLVVDADEEKRGSHLAEMIRNTRARTEILGVMLDESMGKNSRCVAIEELYKSFGELARGPSRG